MSLLTLDADRLVRDAVEAFIEGHARPEPVEDTMFATRNSRYRVAGGVVEEATDTSLMGAELVGWLIEENGLVYVGPVWQPTARAIFVERTQSNHVVVTSRVLTAEVVASAREPVTTLSPRPRLNGAALAQVEPGAAATIRVASSSVPPPEPDAKKRSGKQSVIPPSPPIPQLKTNPSVAPAALVSLGPAPIQPSTAGIPTLKESPRDPKGSDDEITKVDHTEIHDHDRLQKLRELSAEIPIPNPKKSKPGPSTKPPARGSGRGSGRGGPVIPPPPPTPLLGSGMGEEALPRRSRPPPPPRPASSKSGPPRPAPRIEPPKVSRAGKLPPMSPPPSRPRKSK